MEKDKIDRIKNQIGTQINNLSHGVIDGLTCICEVNEILNRELSKEEKRS